MNKPEVAICQCALRSYRLKSEIALQMTCVDILRRKFVAVDKDQNRGEEDVGKRCPLDTKYALVVIDR